MKIRPYVEDDLPQIFEIYSQSKLDELRFETKEFCLLPLQKDAVRLNQLLESDIYICHEQCELIGYGALFGREIRALFVRPQYRGRGIGKYLLEWLLSKAVGEPFLYVALTNHPAKILYAKYGFQVVETFETSYNQQPVFAQKMVCAQSQESTGI